MKLGTSIRKKDAPLLYIYAKRARRACCFLRESQNDVHISTYSEKVSGSPPCRSKNPPALEAFLAQACPFPGRHVGNTTFQDLQKRRSIQRSTSCVLTTNQHKIRVPEYRTSDIPPEAARIVAKEKSVQSYQRCKILRRRKVTPNLPPSALLCK